MREATFFAGSLRGIPDGAGGNCGLCPPRAILELEINEFLVVSFPCSNQRVILVAEVTTARGTNLDGEVAADTFLVSPVYFHARLCLVAKAKCFVRVDGVRSNQRVDLPGSQNRSILDLPKILRFE